MNIKKNIGRLWWPNREHIIHN